MGVHANSLVVSDKKKYLSARQVFCMQSVLTRDIKYLPGVGPKKAELLHLELGVNSYEDLLYVFPYKYIDRSRFYTIRQINSDAQHIQLKGKIIRFETQGEGAKMRLVGIFHDGTDLMELLWFKGQKWVLQKVKTNTEYVIFGRPSEYNGRYNMVHPDIEEVEKVERGINAQLQPFYNTSEKLKSNFISSKTIQKFITNLFQLPDLRIDETLPAKLREQYKLMPLETALFNVHFPQSPDKLKSAQFRLKFEELFIIQLNILRQRQNRITQTRGLVFEKVGEYFNRFYNEKLPFTLTNAQKRVIREIRRDCGSGNQMNRLLQGDVGSGKTMVALMCMLLAIDNGFQASLMAPTEILANQHYATLREFCDGLGVEIRLLTGSTRKKERAEIDEQLRNGSLHILIGTHALIEDNVQFANLGMVIIDEQHKFGVAQRARLWKKNDSPPHILVMTATPIPRTLAMTVYGDLDVSVIDELPPGRKPIKTIHFFDSRRQELYRALQNQLQQGRQVYVVYPLIKESEKMDYKDLEAGFERFSKAFPEIKISCVHGKMKPAEKDKHMADFVAGHTRIMVATTVIEVGVNVPNATVMVIESAERFGLSQLHQLRGRVGRGADQSYCILMTSVKLSTEARQRMEIMTRTNDGFEIAEADLKQRGPGDIEGTQQSGIPFDLRIANLATDGQLIEFARNVARDVLDQDPTLSHPENASLIALIRKKLNHNQNWSEIS